ncbi:hypothetical protein TWF506_008625 [Arthrobotrys conoides]
MVVPGKNMGIRPTNHVDTNGRCYHPYLAYWSQNPDKSTLLDLCGQLKDVFGKEPPLYSKQPVAQLPPQQQPIQSAATPPPPPPRPPLPQEIEAQRVRSHPTPQQQQSADQATPPPPPPPKAEPRHQSPAAYSYTTTPHLFTPQNQSTPQPVASPPLHPPQNNNNNQGPPDRPALPQKLPREEPRPAYPIPSPAYQQTPPQPPPPVPPLPSPIRNSAIGSPGPRSPPPPHSPYHQQHHIAPPPPLPVHPQHGWHPQQPPPPPLPPSQAHRLSGQYEPLNRFPIANQQQQQRPISIHGYPPQQLSSAGPSNLNPSSTTLPQRSQSQRKPFNILDAEDDNASLLPNPVTSKSAVPPPLPPNPEKDRLINEIAKILQQKADAASMKTMASLEQTISQAEAMAKTEAYMERERIELIRINDVCEKDQRILNERIGMADDLIREVRDREAPNIDGVVVAPTVVHNQLYELVTDDMAIEDTIYVLGKALDKERITLDVFLKHTRALAREQFMKRALVKKISRQIGMT